MRALNIRKSVLHIAAGIGFGWVLTVGSASALDISDSPLFLPGAVPPLNMLVMGRDHTLYYEAYNDASDLNGDGSPDVKSASSYLRWAELGNLYVVLGDDDTANVRYRRAVREMDAWAETHPEAKQDRPSDLCGLCRWRAKAYLAVGRKADALKSLAQALRWWNKQEPAEPSPRLLLPPKH